ELDLGFHPERAAALRVDPGTRFSSGVQQNAFIDGILRRTRSIPGITAAGLTDMLPFGGDRGWQVSGKGQVWPKDRHPEAYVRVVSEGYFEAAGIPLRAGRSFTERDLPSGEPVAIINETLARTLWPAQKAVGQMLTQNGGRRVVGVVGDVRHAAVEE